MARLGTLTTYFTANTQGLDAGAKKAKASIGGFVTGIGTTIGIATAAAYAIKKVVDVFGEQEAAEIRLTKAMGWTGKKQKEGLESYKKFAGSVQKKLGLGDEEVLQLAATARGMGIQEKEIKKLILSAIGFAEKYGLEIPTAFDLFARAAKGNTGTMSRYGVVFEKGMTAQQKFQKVLSEGRTGLTQAAEATKTTKGQFGQLWMALGDTTENLGGFIALALNLEKTLPAITKTVEALGSALEFVNKNLTTEDSGLQKVFEEFLGKGMERESIMRGRGLLGQGATREQVAKKEEIDRAARQNYKLTGSAPAITKEEIELLRQIRDSVKKTSQNYITIKQATI